MLKLINFLRKEIAITLSTKYNRSTAHPFSLHSPRALTYYSIKRQKNLFGFKLHPHIQNLMVFMVLRIQRLKKKKQQQQLMI